MSEQTDRERILALRRPFTVLVCGGRDFANESYAHGFLDFLHAQRPITLIVEGGAGGADALARSWALKRRVICDTYPADWRHEGAAAGPMRNKRMLVIAKPDLIVAFNRGGRGTADMMHQAQERGFHVMRPWSGEHEWPELWSIYAPQA